MVVLNAGYHAGTDKAGQDVLYLALKSIRTGMIIGTLTTLIVTPLRSFSASWPATLEGGSTTWCSMSIPPLSSIPDILLIARPC